LTTGILVEMVPGLPTHEPERLTQGDTLSFTRCFTDYTSQLGDSLHYFFQMEDGSKSFDFAASALQNGQAGFQILIATAVTQNWNPGKYLGQAKITTSDNPPQIFTVWEGFLVIEPSIQNPVDRRTHNRRVWEMLKAMIEGTASMSIMRSQVEGVVLERYSKRELQLLCDRYQTKVQKEEQQVRSREGKGDPHVRLSRFTYPGGRYRTSFEKANGWGNQQ